MNADFKHGISILLLETENCYLSMRSLYPIYSSPLTCLVLIFAIEGVAIFLLQIDSLSKRKEILVPILRVANRETL